MRRRTFAGSAGRWLWEWAKSLVVALLLFFVIRTFVVEAFRIPTGSMENTLLVGDFLLVNKAVYGAEIPGTGINLPSLDQPERLDVLVFSPPHEPEKNYVKRVVGVPGDTLMMREKTLFVNGLPQLEPFARQTDTERDIFVPGMLWQRSYLPEDTDAEVYRPSRDNWGPITIPDEYFFMLGDNRDDSEDSRYWGLVHESAVKGRPIFIYYSFDSRNVNPVPWLTSIRWTRIGGAVH